MNYDVGVFTRRRIISPAESYFAVPPAVVGGGTNLLLSPKAFDATDWTKVGTTITPNATTDPDATSLADELVEGSGGPQSWVAFQNVTKAASALVYTGKVYCKAAVGTRRLALILQDNAGSNGVYAVFDIPGGLMGVAATAFGTGWTGGTASISAIGSGWYLCTISGVTSDASTTIGVSLQLDNGIGTGALSNFYTGAPTTSLYLYNAQLTQP